MCAKNENSGEEKFIFSFLLPSFSYHWTKVKAKVFPKNKKVLQTNGTKVRIKK